MKKKELKVGVLVTDGVYTGVIAVFNSRHCVIKHKSGIAKCRIKDLKKVKQDIDSL